MGAMLFRTPPGKHRGHGPLLQGRRSRGDATDYRGAGAMPRAA
jgi:hypothetical protein